MSLVLKTMLLIVMVAVAIWKAVPGSAAEIVFEETKELTKGAVLAKTTPELMLRERTLPPGILPLDITMPASEARRPGQ